MKNTPPALALALALAATAHAPAADAAPTKKQCAAAYEQTQSLRKDGALTAAHEQAVICAADTCPAVVRGDCARWLQEIEASQPTVVFRVLDPEGRETADVRLYVDGQLTRDRLDGKAIPLDPGEHALRFEIDGADPLEERALIREGEKLRSISVQFPSAEPAATDQPSLPPPDEPKGDDRDGGGPPALTWVFGGLGLAAIGVGATFGALALGEKSDLESTCAPRCNDDQIGSVRTKLLIADIGIGAGVVSLGVATVLWLTSGSDDKASARRAPPVRVGVTPLAGGAYAGLSGAF